MSRRLVPVLVLLAAGGCAAGRQFPVPPTTVFRANLPGAVPDMLAEAVRGEGWGLDSPETTREGQTAAHGDEEWDETRVAVAFGVRRPDGDPVLSTAEMAAVLKGVRSEVRRQVRAAGGEVIDSAEGEAYRERWVTLTYKIDKVDGGVRLRLTPASDRPEETANRLEVAVREQPAK